MKKLLKNTWKETIDFIYGIIASIFLSLFIKIKEDKWLETADFLILYFLIVILIKLNSISKIK
ncbi:MAG: hypothetical protein APF84_13870 [Gracilibacter sp. BRH_c7a]|nr:MAG: hypothetical protein APF84_13870 [Gracilibacter sp. BRH_c7a]